MKGRTASEGDARCIVVDGPDFRDVVVVKPVVLELVVRFVTRSRFTLTASALVGAVWNLIPFFSLMVWD
jgi:hypothetical protein